jgi:hypothetical protein
MYIQIIHIRVLINSKREITLIIIQTMASILRQGLIINAKTCCIFQRDSLTILILAAQRRQQV